MDAAVVSKSSAEESTFRVPHVVERGERRTARRRARGEALRMRSVYCATLGHDGWSQRDRNVACANFGDPGCHGFRKVSTGYRIGSSLFRGNHLGRQHAGKRIAITFDSRPRDLVARLGGCDTTFSTCFYRAREKKRSGKHHCRKNIPIGSGFALDLYIYAGL